MSGLFEMFGTRRSDGGGQFRPAAPDRNARFAIDDEPEGGADGVYVFDDAGQRTRSPEPVAGSYVAGKSRAGGGSSKKRGMSRLRLALYCIAGLLLFLGAVVGSVRMYTTPANYDVELGRKLLEKGLKAREACKADTSPRKKALVTLVNGVGKYNEFVWAAEVLGKSLLMHGNIACDVEMVVMVSEPLVEDPGVKDLLNYGWNKIRPAPLFPVPNYVLEQISDLKFRTTFHKLNAFNWTDYETILFMDSDTLVLQDIMPLFNRHVPQMIQKGLELGWAHDQPWSGPYNTFGPTEHNVGIMLIRPSQKLFQTLVDRTTSGKFDIKYSEQGMMNAVFEDPKTYLELPFDYNFNVVINQWNATARNDVQENIKIIHYTTVKPFDPWLSPWNCFVLYAYVDCKEWFLVAAVD